MITHEELVNLKILASEFPGTFEKRLLKLAPKLIEAAEEMHRLKVWSSESHLTDLEAENAELRKTLEQEYTYIKHLQTELGDRVVYQARLKEENAKLKAALEGRES